MHIFPKYLIFHRSECPGGIHLWWWGLSLIQQPCCCWAWTQSFSLLISECFPASRTLILHVLALPTGKGKQAVLAWLQTNVPSIWEHSQGQRILPRPLACYSNTLARLLFMGPNALSQIQCLLNNVRESRNTVMSIPFMKNKLKKKTFFVKSIAREKNIKMNGWGRVGNQDKKWVESRLACLSEWERVTITLRVCVFTW